MTPQPTRGRIIAVTLVLLAGPILLLAASLAVLTAVGARHRGNPIWLAALSGLAFPLAWVLWYVHDEHPHAARVTR